MDSFLFKFFCILYFIVPSILLNATLAPAQTAQGWTDKELLESELLLNHVDIANGYFRYKLDEYLNGNQNINDTNANVYSKIGGITDYEERYQDNDGYYTFYLRYTTLNDVKYYIKWKQKSWLTSKNVIDYMPIAVPNEDSVTAYGAQFKGLALSPYPYIYLDASGDGYMAKSYWNSLGTSKPLSQGGIPCFAQTFCKSARLMVQVVTATPTIFPTNNPSKYPSYIPTISTTFPTMSTTFPTQLPTSRSADNTNTSNNMFFWKLILICGGLISLILVVFYFLCCCYRLKKHITQKNEKNNIDKNVVLRNPMVIIFGIGDYSSVQQSSTDIYVNDLPIEPDIKHLLSLFRDQLCYQTFPQYDEFITITWTQNNLTNKLKEYAKIFEDNIDSGHEFDGLVVVLSGHGIDGSVITSDGARYDKDAIHRIFSTNHPKSRKLPRIMLFDCCEGSEDRKGIMNIGKHFSVNDIDRINTRKSTITGLWERNELNPDWNLAIINAANLGFQSKMDSITGSYLIQKFVEKIEKGVEMNGQSQSLQDIFGEIQNELHDVQLPEAKWNNSTGWVKFKPKETHILGKYSNSLLDSKTQSNINENDTELQILNEIVTDILNLSDNGQMEMQKLYSI